MRPCSGYTSCSRQAWPPIRFGYRQSLGLRSILGVSSVASGRIEFVSQVLTEPAFLRTIPSLPVALHEALLARSYFPFLAGSTAREGLPPSSARSLSSALAHGLAVGKERKKTKAPQGRRKFGKHFCRPYRDSFPLGADPTDKSVGYSLSPSGLESLEHLPSSESSAYVKRDLGACINRMISTCRTKVRASTPKSLSPEGDRE